MIINGLGFSDRPLTLTPQFFEDKALELFFRPGVKAEFFNRFKLGRSLDKVFSYGCSKLFNEIALHVIAKEGIDLPTGTMIQPVFQLQENMKRIQMRMP